MSSVDINFNHNDQLSEYAVKSRLDQLLEISNPNDLPDESEVMQTWQNKSGSILVSVCCPTYNHGALLRNALASFIRQKTSFRFEIIVRDDASTDATRSIVHEFCCKYPNIFRFILEPYNKFFEIGPVNVLCAKANGVYVALCEGDDFWIDPGKLQKQVALLESNKSLSMCGGGSLVMNWDNGRLTPVRVIGVTKKCELDFYDNLYQSTHTSTFLIRKNILKKAISNFFSGHTDCNDAIIRLALATTGNIGVVKGLLSVYRQTGLGVYTKSNPDDFLTREIGLYERLLKRIPIQYRNSVEHRLKDLKISLSRSVLSAPFKVSQYLRRIIEGADAGPPTSPLEKVIIFGAGDSGKTLFKAIEKHCHIVAFSDNNHSIHGQMIFGTPIMPPAEIRTAHYDIVIIASMYCSEIFDQLVTGLGIRGSKIAIFSYHPFFSSPI
jgi:glycosyltransferase involved in cell wall biosynthesis